MVRWTHGALADIHHRDFTQRTLLQQGEQGVGEELPGTALPQIFPGWLVCFNGIRSLFWDGKKCSTDKNKCQDKQHM